MKSPGCMVAGCPRSVRRTAVPASMTAQKSSSGPRGGQGAVPLLAQGLAVPLVELGVDLDLRAADSNNRLAVVGEVGKVAHSPSLATSSLLRIVGKPSSSGAHGGHAPLAE